MCRTVTEQGNVQQQGKVLEAAHEVTSPRRKQGAEKGRAGAPKQSPAQLNTILRALRAPSESSSRPANDEANGQVSVQGASLSQEEQHFAVLQVV